MTCSGRLFFAFAVALAGLALPLSPASAQPLAYGESPPATARGFSAFDTTETEVETVDGGRQLMHVKSSGQFYTEDPASPLNETTYRCFGSHLIGTDGNSIQGHGYCAGVAAEGDAWWIEWQGVLNAGTWEFTGGTGTFEGIRGGGRWQNESALAREDSVTTWSGSWRLGERAPR